MTRTMMRIETPKRSSIYYLVMAKMLFWFEKKTFNINYSWQFILCIYLMYYSIQFNSVEEKATTIYLLYTHKYVHLHIWINCYCGDLFFSGYKTRLNGIIDCMYTKAWPANWFYAWSFYVIEDFYMNVCDFFLESDMSHVLIILVFAPP